MNLNNTMCALIIIISRESECLAVGHGWKNSFSAVANNLLECYQLCNEEKLPKKSLQVRKMAVSK